MVSTKEILYVLLITLAATGGFYGDESYIGFPYGALLPLLLLLLLSTDRPFVDSCPPTCCPILPPCPGRRGRGFGGGFGGFGGFGGGFF